MHSSVLKKAQVRSSEVKRVTFASPTATNEQRRAKKSKTDPRKRQGQHQQQVQKKPKHEELFARRLQATEILVEAEHECKALGEKVVAQHNAAISAVTELCGLICEYGRHNNQSVPHEEICELENLTFENSVNTAEIEKEVKELEMIVSKHDEFDKFLSDLTDTMDDGVSDPVATFYEALPAIERLLAGLSI